MVEIELISFGLRLQNMDSNFPRACNSLKSFIDLDDSMGLLVCTNFGAILVEKFSFPIKVLKKRPMEVPFYWHLMTTKVEHVSLEAIGEEGGWNLNLKKPR